MDGQGDTLEGPAYVSFWHETDMREPPVNFRFRGEEQTSRLMGANSAFDP